MREMKKYTAEDIASFGRDEFGYLICPSGDYTAIESFGEVCRFGAECSFGERCSFGEVCRFGEKCSFGAECSFGERCSFGEWCRFGERCKCEGGHEFTGIFTVNYIGSRNGAAYFWKLTDGGILVRCGCFRGNLEEFAAKVEKTHGDNQHGRAYKAAIELAKVRFGDEE